MGMDPETERHLASIIMQEAARLRRHADDEGVHVYLAKPSVRIRPNPHFLQATVRGVQQSNRMVEVNEMWRKREAELEFEQKHRHRRKHEHRDSQGSGKEFGHTRKHPEYDYSMEPSSSNNDRRHHSAQQHEDNEDDEDDDAALGDEELEKFLSSRTKRGRGAIGSRMDETGPYLSSIGEDVQACSHVDKVRKDWEERILGPNLPDSVPVEMWNKEKIHKLKKCNKDSNKKARKLKKEKRKEHSKRKHKRHKDSHNSE